MTLRTVYNEDNVRSALEDPTVDALDWRGFGTIELHNVLVQAGYVKGQACGESARLWVGPEQGGNKVRREIVVSY